MSFYAEMAVVARDLIREFGQTITFRRVNEAFYDAAHDIAGKDAEQFYHPHGILRPFPSRLIDGTRITTKDRVLILDDTFEPDMADQPMINGRYWSIKEITASNPAGVPLVYFVQVRQ